MLDNVDTLDDKEIVERAKKNPDEFQLLVMRYWDALFRYVRRISYFSPEDTEDVLQEIFIKIYRFINDYDNSMKFSTWAYRIAHNAVIDEVRKRKVRPSTVQLDVDEMQKFLRSSLNIEQEVIQKDALENMKKGIDELPEKYREVLILRFLEEKDYEEIMDILQKPKGTVAALINRGRKKLMEKVSHNEDYI